MSLIHSGINLKSQYQKINILFFIFFGLSAVFISLNKNEEATIAALPPLFTFMFFFCILFILRERRITRLIQVIILFAISYFVIIVNSISYLAGYLLLVFSFFLSNKYQLFYKRRSIFYLILIILLTGVLFFNIVENAYYDEVDVTIWHILNNVNFLVTTILLLIIVFEDDIRKLSSENKRLFQNLDKSKLFINLGENITDLVHHMKNDILILDIAAEMFNEQEKLNPHSKKPEVNGIGPLQCFTKGKDLLSSKVNSIMDLTKFSQADKHTKFNISTLIDSHLEVFKINKDFKRIEIHKDYQKDSIFNGNPMEISLIIENLLKNAFEASLMKWKDSKGENKKFNPTLHIKSLSNSSHIIISIKDNGPGIPMCIENSCNNDCINCSVFKVGKTEKEHGTGVGMISVIRTLKEYCGYYQIKTSLKGTEIEVYLPTNRKK